MGRGIFTHWGWCLHGRHHVRTSRTRLAPEVPGSRQAQEQVPCVRSLELGSRHKLVCLRGDGAATLRRMMQRGQHGHLNGHLPMAEEGSGPPFSATSGRRRRGACDIRSRPHEASHKGYTKTEGNTRGDTCLGCFDSSSLYQMLVLLTIGPPLWHLCSCAAF